ncbi:hypothetical protein ACFQ6Q_40025, partial [Streptomyces sp. NPDC056437]
RDAASARSSATAAEADASSARSTATQAEKDATAAENAAQNADGAAKDADSAADRAEEAERKAMEEDRRKAMEAGGTGVSGGSGAPLSATEEAILLAECGQKCVDQYRQALADGDADIIDWVKANGADVLLEVLGVNNVRRCFGQGDVESCLWALVDVASLVLVIGKLPAVSKAIVKVTSGVTRFFEKAEAGKRAVTQFKKIIERVRKSPECKRVPSSATKSGVRTAAFAGTPAAAAMAPMGAQSPSCSYIPGEIPSPEEINRGSLVKIREKQLEKALKTIDEDAHSFKEGYVGRGVSRFDVFRDNMNRIILLTKDGIGMIVTNVRYQP